MLVGGSEARKPAYYTLIRWFEKKTPFKR